MATTGQLSIIDTEFERLGWNLGDTDDLRDQLRIVARLAQAEIASVSQLPQDKAAEVIARLKECGDVDEVKALTEDGEAPSHE